MASSPESDLLHESSYEMLSDSMIISDDEDQSSVASLSEHSGEDAYSIGEDSDSLDDFEETESPQQESVGIPSFGGLDENTLTDIDLRQHDLDLDSQVVVFDELASEERVSVSTAIRQFDQDHVTNVVTAFHLRTEGQELPENLRVTARQTMGPETLKIDGPFRLMIIGNPVTMESIIEKIGAALAVTALDSSTSSIDDEQRGSRFNIVPVSSFCTDSSPEVELIESFGLEMEVDVCTNATCIKGEKNTEVYSLTMSSNKTVVYKFEAGQPPLVEPRSYKVPHFAVVYLTETDDAAIKQTRMHARSFLRKHDVPMIVISDSLNFEKGTYLTEPHHIDTRTLHLCIESRNASAKQPMIHKRLPVDLKTFLALDVRQMNRNLAVLTGLYEQPVQVETEVESLANTAILEKKPEPEKDARLQWYQRLTTLDFGGAFGVAGWLLALAVFLTAIVGNSYFKAPQDSGVVAVPAVQTTASIIVSTTPKVIPKVTQKPVAAPESSTSLINSISTTLASVASSSSTSTSSSSSASPSCSAKPEWNTLLLDAASMNANESQDFKLHIIGENHILLRPPHKFTVMRKPPQFIIDVFRNEQFVSSEISKLFDGVYAIQIPKEDAWGVMNVTVSTKSRPIVKEVFVLDFGKPG